MALILNVIKKSAPVDFLPNYVNDDSIQIQTGFFYTASKNFVNAQNSVRCCFLNEDSDLVNAYEKYKSQISAILQNNLTTKACYKVTEIVLDIVINKNGEIAALNVEKPSCDERFNKNVVDSISRLSFPAIPLELNRSSFSFKYSVKTKENDSLWQAFIDGRWFGAKQYVPTCIWD